MFLTLAMIATLAPSRLPQCETTPCDCFMQRWNDRVTASDNPESKARDMLNDWIWDHRHAIQRLDPDTLARGEAIVQYMDEHDYAMSEQACRLYQEISERIRRMNE